MSDPRPLNPQQLAAIRHPGGPMRIIAGAGTGKTQTLMYRFLFLVESGVRKDRILCLTYSRKAARELRRRILIELEQGHGTLHISTFHAFCRQLLEQWNRTDQLPPIALLTGPELTQFVVRVVDAIPDDDLRAHRGVFGREKLVANVLTFGSQTRDLLMTPEEIEAYAQHVEPVPGRLHDLALVHRRVTEALAAADVYDFPALGVEVVRRLRSDPALLARIRGQFDHILVDEFQDTNFGQMELIRLLATGDHNVCVVGDANQAIYAFRGGQARFIDEFQETFPGSRTYELGINYRSGQAILDSANSLIRHNPGSDHIVLRANDPGKNATVTVTRAANPALEAAHIVRTILEITRRTATPVRYADIAVLLRSTERNSETIERALAASGIPFRSGDESRGNAEAIRDVLAAVRLAAGTPRWRDAARLTGKHHRDFAQTLRSVEASVPDPDELDALLDRAADISAFSSGEVRAIQQAQRTVQLSRQNGQKELPNAIYHAMLLAGVLGEATDPLTSATMKSFLGTAHAMSEAGSSIAELADQLSSGYDTTPWSPPVQGDGVTVMTVHAAKGLEWPVVLLPAMTDGEFPLPMRLDADFDSETLGEWSTRQGNLPSERERRLRFLCEERRLAYVAMTRAQSELHISFPARDQTGAETQVSQFIAEAGLTDRLSVASWNSNDRPPASVRELAAQLRSRRSAAMATDLVSDDLPQKLAGLWLEQSAAAAGIAGAIPLRARQMPAPFSAGKRLRLSYSQINLYENCPRQYFYARTVSLEEPEESAYLTFGSAVHAALHQLNLRWQESGRLPTHDEIEAAIESTWPVRGFLFKAQDRQLRIRASAILKRYFDWERSRQPARLPILVESSFKAEYGNHEIAGRIDLVLVDDDGGTEIIDFKTSRWNSDSVKKPEESLQLFIYDHVHRLTHPDANPSVSFYALRHNDDKALDIVEHWDQRQVKGHCHSDDSRMALSARLGTLISGIEANDFSPKPSYQACNRCAYRWLCPEGFTIAT